MLESFRSVYLLLELRCWGLFGRGELLNSACGRWAKELPAVFSVALKAEFLKAALSLRPGLGSQIKRRRRRKIMEIIEDRPRGRRQLTQLRSPRSPRPIFCPVPHQTAAEAQPTPERSRFNYVPVNKGWRREGS